MPMMAITTSSSINVNPRRQSRPMTHPVVDHTRLYECYTWHNHAGGGRQGLRQKKNNEGKGGEKGQEFGVLDAWKCKGRATQRGRPPSECFCGLLGAASHLLVHGPVDAEMNGVHRAVAQEPVDAAGVRAAEAPDVLDARAVLPRLRLLSAVPSKELEHVQESDAAVGVEVEEPDVTRFARDAEQRLGQHAQI